MIPFRLSRMSLSLIALFCGTALLLVPALPWPEALLMLAALPALIVAAERDLVTSEIPDIVPVWVLALGLVRLTLPGIPAPLHLATALSTSALLWAASEIWWRSKGTEALGLGDVKLIGAAALFLGPAGLWALMLLAPLGGIAAALAAPDRRQGVPFGPFLGYGVILSHGWTVWWYGGMTGWLTGL